MSQARARRGTVKRERRGCGGQASARRGGCGDGGRGGWAMVSSEETLRARTTTDQSRDGQGVPAIAPRGRGSAWEGGRAPHNSVQSGGRHSRDQPPERRADESTYLPGVLALAFLRDSEQAGPREVRTVVGGGRGQGEAGGREGKNELGRTPQVKGRAGSCGEDMLRALEDRWRPSRGQPRTCGGEAKGGRGENLWGRKDAGHRLKRRRGAQAVLSLALSLSLAALTSPVALPCTHAALQAQLALPRRPGRARVA